VSAWTEKALNGFDYMTKMEIVDFVRMLMRKMEQRERQRAVGMLLPIGPAAEFLEHLTDNGLYADDLLGDELHDEVRDLLEEDAGRRGDPDGWADLLPAVPFNGTFTEALNMHTFDPSPGLPPPVVPANRIDCGTLTCGTCTRCKRYTGAG
jgi:hypothetical protein